MPNTAFCFSCHRLACTIAPPTQCRAVNEQLSVCGYNLLPPVRLKIHSAQHMSPRHSSLRGDAGPGRRRPPPPPLRLAATRPARGKQLPTRTAVTGLLPPEASWLEAPIGWPIQPKRKPNFEFSNLILTLILRYFQRSFFFSIGF